MHFSINVARTQSNLSNSLSLFTFVLPLFKSLNLFMDGCGGFFSQSIQGFRFQKKVLLLGFYLLSFDSIQGFRFQKRVFLLGFYPLSFEKSSVYSLKNFFNDL